MGNERKLMLKAIKHNWGLIGPGDWKEVEWYIFCDGSYQVVSTFIPPLEVSCELPELVKKKTAGRIGEKRLAKLREAMSCEPWRDPTLEIHACDGVAWQIESYKDDGSVENTSGRVGYIYGHRVLETIVSLLPANGNRYGSSGFVSVSKK